MITDTIAAISSPRGKGGVSLIRISGDLTRSVVSRVFVPAGRTSPCDAPRRAVFGKIVRDSRVIDEGICVFFASPASYTGEDCAEITCHGGIAVTASVLEAIFAAGAVSAPAGEFTRRAFINGKLTLSEAEAVGMLIDADTDDRAALAASVTQGTLSAELRRLADSVTAPLSALYANIDYPDEDIGDIDAPSLALSFRSTSSALRALAATERRGRAVAEGVPCAIIGRANGGKSSLYNRLCRSDRAIVTDIAGTTRDVLSETVSFAGITLLLSDTAGLRDSDDTVERIGIDRARRAADEAELVFFVYDLSDSVTPDEIDFARDFCKSHPGTLTAAVFNKSDLPREMTESDENTLREIHTFAAAVSAKTGDGLDALERELAEKYDADIGGNFTEAIVWSRQQRASLESAADSLDMAAASLEEGTMPDAACTLAEDALGELMRLDGRGVSEEIVGQIFARFCVGK